MRVRPTAAPRLRVVIRVAADAGLAEGPDASDHLGMDPLVAALAQLVRDRYAAEARERQRLRVVEGASR